MTGQINAFLKRAMASVIQSIQQEQLQKKRIRFYSRKWCLLTIVFISCCPLLSQAGTPSELKEIHISFPDVNINYIRSLLFLDVCIEIVEQSAFSLFAFMCVYFCVLMSLFYYARFFLFFLGCLIHCHVQFVACTFVTCSNKDQSINQSNRRLTKQYVEQ